MIVIASFTHCNALAIYDAANFVTDQWTCKYRFWSISLDHIWRSSISFDGITETLLVGRASLDGHLDCDTKMLRPDDDDDEQTN